LRAEEIDRQREQRAKVELEEEHIHKHGEEQRNETVDLRDQEGGWCPRARAESG
jgi:hypothetical protein